MKTTKKKVKDKKNISEKFLGIINVCGSLLLIFSAIFFLGSYEADMLFRSQQFSLFLFTKNYFISFLDQPGELLSYAGCFFTQFFYRPWLGTILFVFVLVFLQLLLFRVFRISKYLYFVSFIPSVLLLSFLTRNNYEMFVNYMSGLEYSQIIGFIFAIIFFALYRKIKPVYGKVLFLFILLIAGYPIAGFYALLTVLYSILFELISQPVSRKSFFVFVAGIIFVLLIPFLYSTFIYNYLNLAHIYLYGLPLYEYDFNHGRVWLILSILFVYPLLLMIIKEKENTNNVKRIAINILSVIGCVYSVYFFTNRDENFRNQLKMERAISNRNWDFVLDVARNSNVVPTRVNVMYRNLALHRKNQLCDKMFTYPDGVGKMYIPSDIQFAHISGPLLYYYYGRVNFSYRWCMELMVQYGMKIDYLQYMVKVALINNEPDLARKYLGFLHKTLFYRTWAKEYEAYLSDPESFRETKEYKEITDLMQYEETTDWDPNVMVEVSILNHYAILKSGTRSMQEFTMSSILTLKSPELFQERYPSYLEGRERIPMHIQEAALLYVSFGNNLEIHRAQFSKQTVDRFAEFQREVNLYQNLPREKLAQHMKSRFEKTFWYYYFFK